MLYHLLPMTPACDLGRRQCINGDRGMAFTAGFADGRVRTPARPLHARTPQFTRSDGTRHLRRAIAWFAFATGEC